MPDWNTIVRERLAALRLTADAEADLVEELARHLEDRYRDLVSGGTAPHDARNIALAELDNLEPLRPRTYPRLPRQDAPVTGESPRGRFLEDLARDLRFAVRSLRKSPTFVFFVVLTLGIGIGANTTVFSIINTLILNPLPAQDPDSLASVAATYGSGDSATPAPLPLADLADYRARNQVFRLFAAYTSPRVVTLQQNGGAERMFAEFAGADYFSVLGLAPARGRFFLPEEESASAAPVAVLSYATWQRRFGAADMTGRNLRVNNVVLAVIGVAPPGFIGINSVMGPDIWVPSSVADRLLPDEMRGARTDRAKGSFLAVGRLRPNVTRAQAQANLTAISGALALEYPDTNQSRVAAVRPIRDAILGTSGAARGSAVVFGSAALLVVVGIVLLIACSNVANLLLARSAARQKEMAVRLAMGASRPRLIRQLLTESVVLGLLAGAFGIGAAYSGLHLIFGALPAGANFVAPRLDGAVFGFALLVSLATGFLFGAIPAFQASHSQVADSLKQEARTAGRSRGGVALSKVLLVAQVAFSFLLLVTAALFLRSIGRAYAMDPGFQTAHLVTFMTSPGEAGLSAPDIKAFYRDVRARAARIPGVESVSWSANLPLWSRPIGGLELEGYQRRFQADQVHSIVNTVDVDYFEVAGVALAAGREFSDIDRDSSAPVAIVNEKLAHDVWPSGAIGKRLRLPGERQMRQVIGIARTANYSSWNEAPQACIYVPLAQKQNEAMTLYVRSRGNPGELTVPIEREIRAAAPGILIDSRTGAEIVNGGLFAARMAVTLLTVFGLLALGLASMGLYGILAYAVERRRHEIGLRMALGAGAGTVLRLVLREGMSLVAVGIAIGFAAAILTGRLLVTMLYGVGSTDPSSIAAAVGALCLIALLACYLPARRATRVDPLAALREG